MQKELLSAYLDGEYQNDHLLDSLCQDEELQQAWNHYHLVRTVVRQETTVLLGADFTAKMATLIDAEPAPHFAAQATVAQPTPAEVEKLPFMQKLKGLFAPLTQVAVAATVCLVAVFGVQNYLQSDNGVAVADNPVLQTLPFTNNIQQVSYNAPSQDVPTQAQLEQQSKRINMMLQNYELQRRSHTPPLSAAASRE
ncbi:sigma-E factor negative regulatory protein [Testudinibacter sp. TR-2022]|uniref:sigma-E factor negative regulatory protein n=1 Tax=Testudinibacter sp. TR-2022 TaxID=2585029 RepID=UPI00111B26BB|nr:sigma-E factor negative regulatory protein [Testudinibacter sp. TR-2022]TNH09244.1 transcriptional regulator [Pasteurellaceae bacterium Phil11]TNH25767.1 transcriptional regulator [Testudinibacter sp. TR-2022]TNH28570.1 transcriptional regulator [Testudinibacter sp. TR-2022]